jgi:hypothetical protein
MLPTTLVLGSLVACASGHGALFSPPPRNAFDRTMPKFEGGKGSNCNCGELDAQNNGCDVGTRGGLNGQSCFWFSQGCFIGTFRFFFRVQ